MTQEVGKFGRCRSCGAQVLWALSAASDRLTPLDAEPVVGGNCLTEERGGKLTFTVLSRAQLLDATQRGRPATLYQTHFTSCPQAVEWRRAGKRVR